MRLRTVGQHASNRLALRATGSRNSQPPKEITKNHPHDTGTKCKILELSFVGQNAVADKQKDGREATKPLSFRWKGSNIKLSK